MTKDYLVKCKECGCLFICAVDEFGDIDENNSNWHKKYLDLQKQCKELQDKYTHLQGSMELLGKIIQSNNG